MWLAVDAVKRVADAVSAGNTGALMAMAKIDLNHGGIDRPAIAAFGPRLANRSYFDLGVRSAAMPISSNSLRWAAPWPRCCFLDRPIVGHHRG
jgi:glycerol-3-phosphate acyltransferase PlsX